jgi:hypothetical protein
MRLEIDAPEPFPLRIALRGADGADISEAVHLRIEGMGGQRRDVVVSDGNWSGAAVWQGAFQIRARGLQSGLVARADVRLSPEAPPADPIELTLAPPWRVRVRPSGNPLGSAFRPWRARSQARRRGLWKPVPARPSGEYVDVLLPSEGPWTLELSRGELKATLANVRAVQSGTPECHDVSLAEDATLILDLGRPVRGQPRLEVLPLHADGTPAADKPLSRKGTWNPRGDSARWELPQGRYHFAILDGKPEDEIRLWATGEAVDLAVGRETRLQLAPRPVAIVTIVPPAKPPADWGDLTLHPEEPALAWLAERLRFRERDDDVQVPLWPGSFTVLDGDGKDMYRLHVRAGETRASLMPVR